MYGEGGEQHRRAMPDGILDFGRHLGFGVWAFVNPVKSNIPKPSTLDPTTLRP